MSQTSEFQQYYMLIEKQRGLGCISLCKDVLKHNNIYVFGELFKLSAINELKSNPEYVSLYNTLELFAYGTFLDYKAKRNLYIELTEPQIRKLKLLSLVNLTYRNKIIPYSLIQAEIDVTDIRQLEDIIIEAIYKKLVVAKLDPKHRIIRVTDSIARDVSPNQLQQLINQLTEWKNQCQLTIKEIDKSSNTLKQVKTENQKQQVEVQNLAEQVKASIKDKSVKDDFKGVLTSSSSVTSSSYHQMISDSSVLLGTGGGSIINHNTSTSSHTKGGTGSTRKIRGDKINSSHLSQGRNTVNTSTTTIINDNITIAGDVISRSVEDHDECDMNEGDDDDDHEDSDDVDSDTGHKEYISRHPVTVVPSIHNEGQVNSILEDPQSSNSSSSINILNNISSWFSVDNSNTNNPHNNSTNMNTINPVQSSLHSAKRIKATVTITATTTTTTSSSTCGHISTTATTGDVTL